MTAVCAVHFSVGCSRSRRHSPVTLTPSPILQRSSGGQCHAHTSHPQGLATACHGIPCRAGHWGLRLEDALFWRGMAYLSLCRFSDAYSSFLAVRNRQPLFPGLPWALAKAHQVWPGLVVLVWHALCTPSNHFRAVYCEGAAFFSFRFFVSPKPRGRWSLMSARAAIRGLCWANLRYQFSAYHLVLSPFAASLPPVI